MPSPAKRSSAEPRKRLSPMSRIAHGPNPCSRHCSSAARVSRNASSDFPDARACAASSSRERGVRISRAVRRAIACSAESPTERRRTPLIIARTLRDHSGTLAQATGLPLELNDGITDADHPADQDVGVDSGPMGEFLDDSGSCHLLEMPTRLAELHAEAFHLADPKPFAHKTADSPV